LQRLGLRDVSRKAVQNEAIDRSPNSVPLARASRSKSPVDICGTP